MKNTRYLLRGLLTAAGLLALLALTAMVPAVQTWAAQLALNSRPGLRASLGSVTAGFGRVEVEDSRLEMHGAVLMLPLLHAELPIIDTLRHRRAHLGKLVAKGWTLDLSRGGAGAAAAEGRP